MMVGWNVLNALRPRQNGRHFADDMFKCIFLNENVWIPSEISLKYVPKVSINNNPALVKIMAWCRPGDKPLFELMMVSSLTHICVTRPQWVNVTLIMLVLWDRKHTPYQIFAHVYIYGIQKHACYLVVVNRKYCATLPGLHSTDRTTARRVRHDLISACRYSYVIQKHIPYLIFTCVIVMYSISVSYCKYPGGRLNIKMSSYQYRDPHVKGKTVWRPSYLKHGNAHTWKDGLYIETGSWSLML